MMLIRYDPAGFIMEHYVDGDLVDSTQAPHRSQASPDGLHVWGKLFPMSILNDNIFRDRTLIEDITGPDVPSDFLE